MSSDCMPTGFIYSGLALTALSLILQFRPVLKNRFTNANGVQHYTAFTFRFRFEANQSHLVLATLFTKPAKKLKDLDPEKYDKAWFTYLY